MCLAALRDDRLMPIVLSGVAVAESVRNLAGSSRDDHRSQSDRSEAIHIPQCTTRFDTCFNNKVGLYTAGTRHTNWTYSHSPGVVATFVFVFKPKVRVAVWHAVQP